MGSRKVQVSTVQGAKIQDKLSWIRRHGSDNIYGPLFVNYLREYWNISDRVADSRNYRQIYAQSGASRNNGMFDHLHKKLLECFKTANGDVRSLLREKFFHPTSVNACTETLQNDFKKAATNKTQIF